MFRFIIALTINKQKLIRKICDRDNKGMLHAYSCWQYILFIRYFIYVA